MFYPIFTVNLNAINAMGRSDLFLKIEIVKKAVGFFVLFSSMWFGVWVMACCLLIENLAEQVIDSFPNRKLINYSYFAQMKDILPNIILAVFMGVCVHFVYYLNIVYWVQLIIQIIFGAFISIFFLKEKIDYGYFSVSKINKIKFVFGALLILIPVIATVYLCTAKISSNFLKSSC